MFFNSLYFQDIREMSNQKFVLKFRGLVACIYLNVHKVGLFLFLKFVRSNSAPPHEKLKCDLTVSFF